MAETVQIKIQSLVYSCVHEDCVSDMTPEGKHIKYWLDLPSGGKPTFNFKSKLMEYAQVNNIEVVD